MTIEFEASQNQILENVRKVYSEAVIDHAMNPRNAGEMADADGHGCVLGDCGDRFEMWLKVRDGKVLRAQFWTDGCAAQIACGSVVTELIAGRPLTEAHRVSARDVLAALNDLPDENKHCAVRAVDAVKEAVRDSLATQREPWKKAYRKG